MFSKILTSYVASIDAFMHNPHGILKNTKEGIVAIIINNVPAFYAISSQRLEKLLNLETHLMCPKNDFILDNQSSKTLITSSVSVPIGKFAMYSSWKPDADFQRMATLWGIQLTQQVTTEELAAFISYWQVEKKVFHHIQWQQKLARSLQIRRASNNRKSKIDIDVTSKRDNYIPTGFKG